MLDGENQTEHFDIAKDDEMDGLREGAMQTLATTMDEEQHEKQISQVSKRVSSKQIADLHERAQRARQLQGQEGRRPSIQSMLTAKSSDEAVKRIQGAQRGLLTRNEERREQTRDSADSSSTAQQRQTRTHKETIDYSTDINHWKGSTVKEEDL